MGPSEDKYCKAAEVRSENSLAWGGFALTNFVTILAVFSAFGRQISLPVQITLSLFLIAGAFSAVSWSLYENVSSELDITLPEKTKFYKLWVFKIKKDDKIVENPRKTYFHQAEWCIFLATLSWSLGVVIFLYDLGMYITMYLWIVTFILVYAFTLPRYFIWIVK